MFIRALYRPYGISLTYWSLFELIALRINTITAPKKPPSTSERARIRDDRGAFLRAVLGALPEKALPHF